MNVGSEREYCLRWNNHENNVCLILGSMLKRGVLVDVTLYCEGKSHKVHRTVLSACSPYFEELFTETDHPHPIVILKDVKSDELQSLISYMYTGQVTVSQGSLNSFLKMAESLKIRGLMNADQFQQQQQQQHQNQSQQPERNQQQDDLLTDPDSCVPIRKRRRKLEEVSAEMNQLQTRTDFSPEDTDHPLPVDAPTDLSLPKSDSEVIFQPVIQAVSYSDPTNNQPGKIYLKPKEALISPPLSEMSDGSSAIGSISEQVSPINDDFYRYQNNRNSHIVYSDSLNSSNGPGLSHGNQSDDEDVDFTNQDSEGTSVVRSGICSVCGCFRSDLRQHMDSHSGQSFQCHICGRAYPRRKTLNQHIKRSHPRTIPDANGTAMASR